MKKNKVLLGIGLVCLFILFAASFAPAEDGVTDTSIKVGYIGALTGPLAAHGEPILSGMKIFAKYVNEQGGVNGRKIEIVAENDSYSPPQTVAAAKKMITRDKVFCFVGNLGTAPTISIRPLLAKQKVPLLFPGTAATTAFMPVNRYVFSSLTTYTMEGRLHADFIANCVDNPKIFIFFMDGDIGKEYSAGLKAQLKHYGLGVIDETSHKYTTVDYSSHALKAKNSGANVVTLYSIGSPVARFVLECKKIGYKPQFILGAAPSISELLKLAGDAIEGAIGTQVGNLQTSYDPVVRKYREVQAKYHPGKPTRNVELLGFGYLRTASEAFKRCGRDLTRENLIKALESFKDYDTGVNGPITFSPSRRIGAESAIIHTNRGGQYKYYVPGWHSYKRF
ncbi:ABC transporter substrate-binding protein [Thermodesulfobacteriota bacterium]